MTQLLVSVSNTFSNEDPEVTADYLHKSIWLLREIRRETVCKEQLDKQEKQNQFGSLDVLPCTLTVQSFLRTMAVQEQTAVRSV